MFPRALRVVSAATLALFALLCALHLHGFSLPGWHEVVDGSAPGEVLFGTPRGIRVDDWVVALPTIFSQDAREPRFAPVNDLIGYGGVDALVGYSLPVKSWVTLFRPQLWGYFAGRDLGMAWQWWLRLLGLFFAAYLCFSLLTRGRTWIALGAAAVLLFSPFFQFWSFNCEPVAALALLCFTCVAGIGLARGAWGVAAWAALLAWSASSFALAFLYPPFQIPLAWLLVFLTAGYLFRERERIREGGRLGLRAAAAGIALAAAGCAIAAYLVEHQDAIRSVRATLYPGQRLSSGGEWRAVQLVDNYLNALLGPAWWEAISNVSESGAFFFTFPLTLAVVAWRGKASLRRIDPVIGALASFVVLGSAYAIVGVPDAVARMLFAGRVPGQRMTIALGIADAALLALFAASASRPSQESRAVPIGVAGLWSVGLALAGLSIVPRVAGAGSGQVVLAAVVWGGFALALVLRGRIALAILVAVSIAVTAGFNPLVRGGSEFLTGNAFSREVLALDRAGGGRTRWVVFGEPRLANLFRAIGVANVGGMHYTPQMQLWSRLGFAELDWAPRYYNRYGNVSFWLPRASEGGRPALGNPSEDAIAIYFHPDDPRFRALGVDYVVWVGPDRGPLSAAATLTWVASLGDKHIFRSRPPG